MIFSVGKSEVLSKFMKYSTKAYTSKMILMVMISLTGSLHMKHDNDVNGPGLIINEFI